ncbi:LADA_0G01178g1_1 [Lachancea dasiensis]|uniref:LADA_0G01178g1_1 n=1 Tax=Lachancea dasiensis TaxID=1072105 RepID=A0A1G4JQM5_9SACH|nr:LADA_0G01178g1_1 [Lachancea dasiensis]
MKRQPKNQGRGDFEHFIMSMDVSEADIRTKTFYEWAKTAGKLWISDKITLVRHPTDEQQGRCVMALENIAKGEKLFEIPRESVLNVSTTSLCVEKPALREVFMHQVGHWEGLIIAIFYELKVVGENSPWWPYFRVWPEAVRMNSLMYWSDSEVAHLRPSGVCDRIGQEGAREMYQRVLDHVRELELSDLETITWEEFVLVASVIMAYSFDMERADYEEEDEDEDEEEEDEEEEEGEQQENEGEEEHGEVGSDVERTKGPSVWKDGFLKSMVPMADMLNADTHKCNANLTYSPESLIMVAIEDIPSGSQVYNIYGEFPNSEILRRYGYVEWSGSKYDAAEIPLKTITSAAQTCLGLSQEFTEKVLYLIEHDSEIKDEVLEGESMVMDSYDCYLDGQFAPEYITTLQILSGIALVPKVETLGNAVLLGYLKKLVKRAIQSVNTGEMTRNCANTCVSALDMRLRDYPSHSFREPSPSSEYMGELRLRERLAECVLRGEVKSLQNCAHRLEKEYQLIDDQVLLDKIMTVKRKVTYQKNKSKVAKKAKR